MYRHNAIKPISPLKKYEYLREHGVQINGHLLKGKALDDYIEEAYWRQHHPGQEPVREWDVPAK